MCTLKGGICYRYLWLGVWEKSTLICRARLILGFNLFPSLLTIPPMRLLAVWRPGEEEALPEFRVEFCFARDPVRGLWEKNLTAR